MENEWPALIMARKTCRICVQRSPGKIRSCAEFDFDPDVVSHWEQWLGHRSPKLLLVGQDFGNVDYFVRHRGRDEPHNPTNDNLQRLLAEAGVRATNPPEPDPEAPVFATNSILCLKEGRMNGSILASWVDSCAEAHLRPLVRYLRPPIVVGMGAHAWRAVRRVFALDLRRRKSPRRREAIGSRPIGLASSRSVIPDRWDWSIVHWNGSSRIGGGSARLFPRHPTTIGLTCAGPAVREQASLVI